MDQQGPQGGPNFGYVPGQQGQMQGHPTQQHVHPHHMHPHHMIHPHTGHPMHAFSQMQHAAQIHPHMHPHHAQPQQHHQIAPPQLQHQTSQNLQVTAQSSTGSEPAAVQPGAPQPPPHAPPQFSQPQPPPKVSVHAVKVEMPDNGSEQSGKHPSTDGSMDGKKVKAEVKDEYMPGTPAAAGDGSVTGGVVAEGGMQPIDRKQYTQILLQLFEKNKYPQTADLEQVSNQTGWPVKKIRSWFQSQRNKERKAKGLVRSGKRLAEPDEANPQAGGAPQNNTPEQAVGQSPQNLQNGLVSPSSSSNPAIQGKITKQESMQPADLNGSNNSSMDFDGAPKPHGDGNAYSRPYQFSPNSASHASVPAQPGSNGADTDQFTFSESANTEGVTSLYPDGNRPTLSPSSAKRGIRNRLTPQNSVGAPLANGVMSPPSLPPNHTGFFQQQQARLQKDVPPSPTEQMAQPAMLPQPNMLRGNALQPPPTLQGRRPNLPSLDFSGSPAADSMQPVRESLASCPPQIGRQSDIFSFRSLNTAPPTTTLEEEILSSGRSSGGNHRSSDDMDLGCFNTRNSNQNSSSNSSRNNSFQRSFSIADPLGMQYEAEKQQEDEVYDDMDFRNILCPRALRPTETLDLNAIDRYYDKLEQLRRHSAL